MLRRGWHCFTKMVMKTFFMPSRISFGFHFFIVLEGLGPFGPRSDDLEEVLEWSEKWSRKKRHLGGTATHRTPWTGGGGPVWKIRLAMGRIGGAEDTSHTPVDPKGSADCCVGWGKLYFSIRERCFHQTENNVYSGISEVPGRPDKLIRPSCSEWKSFSSLGNHASLKSFFHYNGHSYLS